MTSPQSSIRWLKDCVSPEQVILRGWWCSNCPERKLGLLFLKYRPQLRGLGSALLRFITSSQGLANLAISSSAQAQEATGTKKGSGTQNHFAAGLSPGNAHDGRAAGPN